MTPYSKLRSFQHILWQSNQNQGPNKGTHLEWYCFVVDKQLRAAHQRYLASGTTAVYPSYTKNHKTMKFICSIESLS